MDKRSPKREMFPIRVFQEGGSIRLEQAKHGDTTTFAIISLHPAQVPLLIKWLTDIQAEM